MFSIMRLTASKRSPAAGGLICAAAFSSLPGSSWAFVTPSVPTTTTVSSLPRPLTLNTGASKHPILSQSLPKPHQHRLYFSQKDESDWETFKRAGSNLLKKGADKIKSIIPFGKSEEEKRAEIIKKERKEEISGGINSMLKDMPFPVRMMGKMVSPLLARAADEIAEQAAQAQDTLEDARFRIMNDPILIETLGDPIQVGQPFSQSSSTTVINGKSSAMVRASFQVGGSRGTGIATVESSNNQITSLTVNVNGRNISVGTSRGGSVFGKSSSSSKNDNIIEAEIIEKK